MAHIGMHLGFTFRFGEASNQFAKIDVEVNDIDVDVPLEPQLEKVDSALDVVWRFLKNEVDIQIDEIIQKGRE